MCGSLQQDGERRGSEKFIHELVWGKHRQRSLVGAWLHVHLYYLQKTKQQFKNDQYVDRDDRVSMMDLSITCTESKCYEVKVGDMIISSCCCNQNLCNDGRRMDVPRTSLLLTFLIGYLSSC